MDMFKIHAKNLRPKDQGSKDKGLVYVAFNSGMFEAIKKNLMKFLIDANKVGLTKQPKIEYYDSFSDKVAHEVTQSEKNPNPYFWGTSLPYS